MNPSQQTSSSNFEFLREHEVGLVLLAGQAERLFVVDAAACIGKLRLFAELLAREVAARVGQYSNVKETQVEMLGRLRRTGILSDQASKLFHSIRIAGNAAAHENLGDHGAALHALKLSRELAVWFHRTFGKDKKFQPLPFEPPRLPEDATGALRSELATLKAQLAAAQSAEENAKKAAEEAHLARLSAEERAKLEASERAAAEELMEELAARESAMVARLANVQAKAVVAPANELQLVVQAAAVAAESIELDEPATRRLIDEQLREAGWEVDTTTLRWSEGTRPQKGKNLAIAEWPTESGPVDYALFVGLVPIAVVEAKRESKDIPAVLGQAARYARGFTSVPGLAPAGPFADADRAPYRIPFLFATNGRAYLAQISERSGIWFRDARRPQNHAKVLAGWYTPAGLVALLAQDVDAAHEKLKQEDTEYLGLRGYQLRAIAAVEGAIENGARSALVAMATGTGKTKTCIGLCYRLLKANRFRRILFVVDRSALGSQAKDAFNDTKLEGLQTLKSTFGLRAPDDREPDTGARMQIATIQSLVHDVLYSDPDGPDGVPSVDAFDCIIVDECHRGYTLDREMSEGELVFRDQDDYVSKYRRVLDYFDAVKIGLTATPALHTRQIFGAPIFTYSYREAVVDDFLVDHEPPVRITTALAEDGITFLAGEEVEVYQPDTKSVQLSLLPDEVHVDVEQFNKQVRTENFNRVVCEVLAQHIDPSLEGKTLVFCATDAHANMVVELLKEAFAAHYGEVEDAAVVKITGAADRPMDLIRRFKNERTPSVVVTVDLLTTGIDVPEITNLVFLRRVRSRILYDQMIGRATRLCPSIKKECFRIYDAVDLYSALLPYTDMKPVVVSPTVSFATLMSELASVTDEKHRTEVFEQLIAKLNRKLRHLDDRASEAIEAATGKTPEDFVTFLREGGATDAGDWLASHPALVEILDRPSESSGGGMLVSQHADSVRSVAHGYGQGRERPEDYLDGFARYLKANTNALPALMVVTQRPRDLTREQLKSLKLALDTAGYTEMQLRTAWRDHTNQDIAASIIGHIRQAALGDALVPYEERVARAVKKIIASRVWTDPQRKWLENIGRQLRAEVVVDREALDRGVFATQGGFNRMNKVFDGKLEGILGDLVDEVWKAGA